MNLQKTKKQAFTLVELIVVITILAILGTIAFISLQGYSRDARYSVRINDISNIKTSLELFNLNSGKYPIPSNSFLVTYSGAIVWYAGNIGDSLLTQLSNINAIPTDPLTENKYSYSVLKNKQEYQIGAILEANGFEKNNSASAYVTGNYNGLIAKVSTGFTDYVLAIPSILTSDTEDVSILDIINNNSFVYDSYSNAPGTYKSYSGTGGFIFNPNPLIVYEGDINNLVNNTEQESFITNLKSAYSGTTLSSDSNYSEILGIDLYNQVDISNLVMSYTNNHKGGLTNLGLEYFTNTTNNYICEEMSQENVDNLNLMSARFDDWDGGMIYYNNWSNEFPECDSGYVEYNGCVLTKSQWCNVDTIELWQNAGSTIASLPDELKYLSALKTFSMGDGVFGIGVVPSLLYELSRLEYFQVGGMNGSITIPSEIGNLVNLKEFSIYTTQITSIAPEMWDLNNLIYFGLDDVQLSSLDAGIGNFTLLETISLSDNNLSLLPSELSNLTNITSLNLNNNASLGNLNLGTNSWNPAVTQANITPLGESITVDGSVSPYIITVTP